MNESALRTLLDNLDASRSSLHGLLHVFTFLVVVGLGFDLFVILKEFRDDLKEFRRGEIHPPERPSLLLLILGLVGTALIVIGVAGELYVDVKAGKVETDIRAANDALLGLISQQAGDAKTSAEGAADAAAHANDAAGEAQIKAERASRSASSALVAANGARKEAVAAKTELAQFRAPRIISEADKKRWIDRLSNFPGTPFSLAVGTDSDVFGLRETVQSILKAAKWKQLSWNANIFFEGSDPRIGLTAANGVVIEADISRLADWGQQTGPMEALQELFMSSRIPAKANIALKGVPPEAIHIIIGNRLR